LPNDANLQNAELFSVNGRHFLVGIYALSHKSLTNKNF